MKREVVERESCHGVGRPPVECSPSSALPRVRQPGAERVARSCAWVSSTARLWRSAAVRVCRLAPYRIG